MKTKIIGTMIGVWVSLLPWALPASGQMTSASYRISARIFNSGGVQAYSENHRLLTGLGPSAPLGSSQSSSFLFKAGLIPQIAASSIHMGLAAYYPLNGNANDESGNGNQGIVQGATLTEDRFGNTDRAYYFDGLNRYIDCGHGVDLNPADGSFTIGLWIRPHELSGLQRFIWKNNGLTPPFDGYYFMTNGSGLAGGFGDTVNSSEVSGGTLQEDVWYFVAMVRDIGVGRVILYQDGVKINSSPDTTGNIAYSGNLAIGGRPEISAEMFYGSIDDVRIYNRALSEAEVQTLYSANLHVYPGKSIQAAISLAKDGDEIIVHPGTYQENVHFMGKSVIVRSIAPDKWGIVAATVIDGGKAGSVATFTSGENSHTGLCGLTLRNGRSDSGGGVFCQGSSPNIANCMITENRGGGISCWSSSSPHISNCIIAANTTNSSGGGIYALSQSSPMITNCSIRNNAATLNGGGVAAQGNCSLTLINCALVDNISEWDGGGIYCWDNCTMNITHGIIASNNAAHEGGGIFSGQNCSIAIKNSILWQNIAHGVLQPVTTYQGMIAVTFSDIQGGYTGLGNIDADPGFLDLAGGDYHLQAGSPCLDAGIDEGAPETDLEGNPRPGGAGYDMGAYEFMPYALNVTHGLVAYYPFNGNAEDESGNGNTGNVYGASLTSDRFGHPDRAYQFDGIDDYMAMVKADSLDVLKAITIAGWVYRMGSNTGHIVTTWGWNGSCGGTEESYALVVVEDGDNATRLLLNNGYSCLENQNGPLVPLNQWAFLVGTYDGTEIKLYMNGALVDTITASGDIQRSTVPIHIGAMPGVSGLSHYFHGVIDDLRLYNRALSEYEIQALYSFDTESSAAVLEGDYTTSSQIHLSLRSQDATEMMISESPEFINALWEPYQTKKVFTLSSGIGERTIYVKFRNEQQEESGVVSTTIIVDPICDFPH